VSDARGGEHVLYWMQRAVRGHENPALERAIQEAEARGVPLVVFFGLAFDQPYLSDRHAAFALEGARDAQRELSSRGIALHVHLRRNAAEPRVLEELAARAALVVVEDVPLPPFRAWRRALARATAAEIVAVDAACLVLDASLDRTYDRAFEFRAATRAVLEEALARVPQERVPRLVERLPQLPFRSLDLQSADLAELLASCDIDHSIAPVTGTRGGAVAGYARWAAFRDERLGDYARDRDDALLDGVSRLSPYLVHGHVSPHRIAREAAARARAGCAGAEKFLDELLVWRELAWHACRRQDDPDSFASIPAWARRTLAEHQGDARAFLPLEALARARSGDALWDAAQRSLLIHGELHNNVRMTWGKALLGWSRDAREAYQRALELNHRYALDGFDPNSYGGIQWCFGGFDRPFDPEQPIYGSVRTRPTSAHAKRLDVASYAARTGSPAHARPLRVAVVGGGIGGLACARTLHDHGFAVRVFDKGRGPGGRSATRRVDELAFDHGAQYFTARSALFQRCVERWREMGLVAEWRAEIAVHEGGALRGAAEGTRRFVAVPRMSALAAQLGADLDVRYGVRVGRFEREGARWRLEDEHGEGLGSWDAIVVNAPAPQAAALLAPVPALAARAAAVEMTPCIAAMVAFEDAPALAFGGAFVNGDPVLSWVADNASKPGRSPRPAWTLHATPEWSRAHFDAPREIQADMLVQAFARSFGCALPRIVHLDAHRWAHAIPREPHPESCLWDAEQLVAACGDWCGGPRIEGAYLSGVAAAGRLLAREL
jgi:photolyase PhrII